MNAMKFNETRRLPQDGATLCTCVSSGMRTAEQVCCQWRADGGCDGRVWPGSCRHAGRELPRRDHPTSALCRASPGPLHCRAHGSLYPGIRQIGECEREAGRAAPQGPPLNLPRPHPRPLPSPFSPACPAEEACPPRRLRPRHTRSRSAAPAATACRCRSSPADT